MSTITPTTNQRPRLRWWLPGVHVEDRMLTCQLESVKSAGFGGVEVAWFGLGHGKQTQLPDDLLFGSKRWNESFQYIVSEGKRLGLHIDFTISASYPCHIPGLLPADHGTAIELVNGTRLVRPGETFDGPLPEPPEAPSGHSTAFSDLPSPLHLISSHVVEVDVPEGYTDDFRGPWKSRGDPLSASVPLKLPFTAPENDDVDDKSVGYLVMASYWRGTAQHKTIWEKANSNIYCTPRGTVPDHFDVSGVEAVKDFYSRTLFTQELKEAFKQMKSAIFEDSLELHHAQYWTPNLVEAFSKLRGYDPTPYLPWIHEKYRPSGYTPHLPVVSGGDCELVRRVIHDFKATLSDLYLKQHLQPLISWANENGLLFRCQPYELDMDGGLAASQLDIVEGETLLFGDNHDAYRLLASGRDVGGKTILSDELAANKGQVYELSWKRIIQMANLNCALGVNQFILHGLPYPESSNSRWPGYMPFLPNDPVPSFSEAWGERQPQWQFSKSCTDYLARTQAILQSGKAQVDLAIYHPYLQGVHVSWKDTSLTSAGYSYGFLTDGLLARSNARVLHGRLFSDGPAYKALIINDERMMELETARKVKTIAETGLPVIIIGTLPTTTPGHIVDQKEADREVELIFSTVVSLPHCAHLPTTTELTAALNALEIEPLVRYRYPDQSLLAISRVEGLNRWFYFYNDGDTSSDQIVQLTAKGNVSLFDAWTGRYRPVHSTVNGGKIEVRVELCPKAASIVRVAQDNQGAHEAVTGLEYLNFDKMKHFNLHDWSLEIEDWVPQDIDKIGLGSAATIKNTLPLISLHSLKPWTEISGLEGTAGVAKYTCHFSLPAAKWVALSFPPEQDCVFSVCLNGWEISGDSVGLSALNFSEYIQENNVLQIRIATTIVNKMKSLYPTSYSNRPTKTYGLLGATISYLE